MISKPKGVRGRPRKKQNPPIKPLKANRRYSGEEHPKLPSLPPLPKIPVKRCDMCGWEINEDRDICDECINKLIQGGKDEP